ncbi:hypothetical protein KRMM14A1259_41230 [Krasilnikovia sp. MM14-A1259]
MLNAFSRAVHRWRHPVIAAVLVATLGGAAAAQYAPPTRRTTIYLGMFGVLVLMFVVSVIVGNVVNRRAPRTLDVVAGGYETPQHGYGVLMAASMFPMIGVGLGLCVEEVRSGRHAWAGTLGAAVAVALLGWLSWLLRTTPSIRFAPAGLTVHRVMSTVVVPWDALDRQEPVIRETEPVSLKLVIGRADLVERHGLTAKSDRLGFDGADIEFVMAVTRYYVAHPEHRAAIGVPGGLVRLGAELPPPAPVPVADLPVREPGVTRGGIVTRVVFLCGGIAVHTTATWWWLSVVGDGVAMLAASSLGRSLHPVTWIRQQIARRRAKSARRTEPVPIARR